MVLVWEDVTQSQYFIEPWAACPVICLPASVLERADCPLCSSPLLQALCRICFSSAQRYKHWLKSCTLTGCVSLALNQQNLKWRGFKSDAKFKESWSGKWLSYLSAAVYGKHVQLGFCWLTGNVIPAGVRPVRSQQPLANLDAFCILVLFSNMERKHSCISVRSVLYMAQNKTAINYLVATS